MSPSATPATQSAAASPATNRAQASPSAPPNPAQRRKRHACHAKRRHMSPSATPATRSEGGCRQAPRLPRKVPQRHGQLTAPKRATESSPVPEVQRVPRKTKVHVTKSTSATRSEGECRQVPRLAHKVPRRHRRLTAPKRATRSSPAAQVPCLPRKVPWRHRRLTAPKPPKRTTRSSPGPQVPRLPRKVPRRHRRLTAPKRGRGIKKQTNKDQKNK